MPQRKRVAEHLITRLPVLDGISDRRDGPGGLDAERHWRGAADIPLARADELLPVADARGPDFDQGLVVREGPRIWRSIPPTAPPNSLIPPARIKEALSERGPAQR